MGLHPALPSRFASSRTRWKSERIDPEEFARTFLAGVPVGLNWRGRPSRVRGGRVPRSATITSGGAPSSSRCRPTTPYLDGRNATSAGSPPSTRRSRRSSRRAASRSACAITTRSWDAAGNFARFDRPARQADPDDPYRRRRDGSTSSRRASTRRWQHAKRANGSTRKSPSSSYQDVGEEEQAKEGVRMSDYASLVERRPDACGRSTSPVSARVGRRAGR